MFSEQELQELSQPTYWNARYLAEQQNPHEKHTGNLNCIKSYEWFRTFDSLYPFFQKHIGPPSNAIKILHLGCGNSSLTSDLYHEGYTNQISIDFSPVLIDAMKKKYSSLETEWSVMDVRELDLEVESVDFAIDKGTLDAFLHGSLWDPPEDVAKNVGLYVDQIMRVLKLGGKWLYITYRQPHFIKPFLYRINSTTDVEVLDDVNGAGCFSYFGYIISKEGNIDSQS